MGVRVKLRAGLRGLATSPWIWCGSRISGVAGRRYTDCTNTNIMSITQPSQRNAATDSEW